MSKTSLGVLFLVSLLAVSTATIQGAVPQTGGTLIIGLEGEPASATAHLATDTAALIVAGNIFNGLIGCDMEFNPTPDLAESWSISGDGLVYTFNLAKNARWHDGKPITAEDVEYSFNEIIAKVHPRGDTWWPNVEWARTTDKYTFVMRLRSPFSPLMTILSNILVSGSTILPKHIYQGTDPRTNPANLRPIGSGAFKFKEWVKGSHIELVRNENYFKKGKPYLDRIVVQFTPDASSRLMAFEKGELDFLHWYIVPHEQVARLRKDPRFKIVEKGGESAATNELLLFNHRAPYLKDPRVRQAIAYALDRNEIQTKSLFGEGKVAKSHISSGIKGFYTDRFDYKQDIKKANQLLDAAGYPMGPDGKRFVLRDFFSTGRPYEDRAAEIVRDQLKAVGIEVKIETFDRLTFVEWVFKKWDFDMAHQLFTTGPDPTVSVTPRYHTKEIKKVAFTNGMGYSNPEVDRLFDTEYMQTDTEKRRQMWIKIQEILMRDLPALPLFEIPIVNAVSAKFNDVITTPYGYVQSREDAYLVK